jgi:hypothetical protein
MDIETVIGIFIGLAVLGVIYRYWPKSNGLDVNSDGKVDLKDAAAGAEVVVAKAVEEIKVETAKVEEVVVAKYKEELAAFVETETKVAKELVAEVEKVVEEVKAVEAKVEEVVVAEVKKVATRAKAAAKKTADVNKDGKVDVADAKAVVKKVVAKVTKAKKPKA